MASPEKIRGRIREIAQRPNNVAPSEIEWVMNQLDSFGQMESSGNVHQRLYTIDGERFSVCTHRKGSRQLKAVYVKEFLKVMVKTGWYED